MATVTAQMVKELRSKTDMPMMECKAALTQCAGDLEAALEWLRKKHRGKMSERADRSTGEGRIGVYIDAQRGVGSIIELQCETAPVANNDTFIELVDFIANKVADSTEPAPDSGSIRKDADVDRLFTETFGKLRETMNIGSCRRIQGEYLCSYVHHDGKSGVLIALDTEPKSEKNIGGDLCMHALFTRPMAIDRSGIPADRVEKVRNDAIELARADKKPEQIIEKIAEGKVNAFYANSVLTEQLHVKTDEYGKKKIGDCLSEAGVGAVTDIAILRIGG